MSNLIRLAPRWSNRRAESAAKAAGFVPAVLVGTPTGPVLVVNDTPSPAPSGRPENDLPAVGEVLSGWIENDTRTQHGVESVPEQERGTWFRVQFLHRGEDLR